MWGYIPLIGAICNLLLTVFVALMGPRTTVIRVYALLGASIVVWNLGTFYMFRVRTTEEALFWARFIQFGVIFIPLLLFHVSLLIAQVRVGKYIKWFYLFTCGVALTNANNLFISRVKHVGYGYYAVAGPAFWLFMLIFGLVYVSVFVLFKRRSQLPPFNRRRLTSLIVAQGVLAALGMNDILPILGIYYYPWTSTQIYPFGSMAAIFYGLIVGYSVFQHQLLDIRISLGRWAAHILRLGFMFFVGFFLLLICTVFEQSKFTPFAFFSSMAVLLISGVVASICFPRLFGRGTEFLEKRIMGDRFEYHDRMREFIQNMQWYTDFDLLMEEFNQLLVQTMRVTSYSIILRDDAHHAYVLLRAYPDRGSQPLPELKADSPLLRFFETTGAEYFAPNFTDEISEEITAEKEMRQFLSYFQAEFCLPFIADQEPFGLLLLGNRQESLPFTGTDISLLVSLVRQLSLLINQIRLKNQVLQAQEIELMGRMSRGMAHDLNNLVTPIQTLLQLINEGIPAEDVRDDLLPVALRSVDTLREYVREALFFSQNARPDFRMGRLDVLLLESADIVAPRCANKNLQVMVHASPEVLVEMDKSLIKRMVTNVLSNAADASPEGATITIDLARLSKTEKDRDWVRVRVIDSGEGIKPEDMNRIFAPYFTTKNRGDQQRGFGLGLSICRKVVQLHGGSLKVLSQPNKGTTIQIDLPDRQVNSSPAPEFAPAA